MTPPIASFFRVVERGLPPTRATRSALGQLPVSALRFCEAVASASCFGWYIFPPVGFRLMWDGYKIAWSFDDGSDEWFALDAAQYPNALTRFDNVAPASCRGFCPPWLVLGNTSGIVQVWTGIIVATAPEWSILVRAPANIAHDPGFEVLEGIIETDRWTGPLFSNLKLVATDTPFRFPEHRPFLQVVPLHRSAYSDDILNGIAVASIGEMPEAEWRGYHETIVENASGPLGSYAAAVGKRRVAER